MRVYTQLALSYEALEMAHNIQGETWKNFQVLRISYLVSHRDDHDSQHEIPYLVYSNLHRFSTYLGLL